MKSGPFQNKVTQKLQEYFLEVKKEWPIAKNATDLFSPSVARYAPRLDVAVGPFSISRGNMFVTMKDSFESNAPKKLREFVEDKVLKGNPNPRCTLAIEVAYNGSSKHMLGDITNASMMGLYGFVIGSTETIGKLDRIFEYSRIIKQVGKAPADLFSNVCVISDEKFMSLLKK